MVVCRYIAASAAGRSTAEAHGVEPDSTTESSPLCEKSGDDDVMLDHIIFGRVVRQRVSVWRCMLYELYGCCMLYVLYVLYVLYTLYGCTSA